MPLVDRTMKAAVVSLHFSPAHASHMAAYGMLLQDIWIVVSLPVVARYPMAAWYFDFYDFAELAR